ncbi:MAG: hypothetical protein U5R46_05920 [Gammaproteobacteria bacterium]|nr:hypothetical protein [Gammaproteobacteria bacterium]
MKRILSFMILILASTLAFGSQCPMDMAAIDKHLAGNPDLTDKQMTQVKELREQGEQLHNEGKHDESVEALAEAKEILGIE